MILAGKSEPADSAIRSLAWITASLLGLALLSGCSTARQFPGIPVSGKASLITSVPPFLQDKYLSCGPTCVAAVAGYWQKDIAELEAAPKGGPFTLNFSARDLEVLGNRLGMQSFIYEGSISDLEGNIRKGRPLLILLPKPEHSEGITVTINGIPLKALWRMMMPEQSHWVVAIGFSESDIIVHDPAHGRIAIPRGKFERWWKAKRNTCVLQVLN